ncbi:MAG: sugar-binding domain-containing protein [Planctomycetota bacterium]|jgi:hypothetical protein
MKYTAYAAQNSCPRALRFPDRRLIDISLAALTIALITQSPANARQTDDALTISLAGQWAFKLDPQNVGHKQKWYQRNLPDRIRLPGSTDQAGYGTKTTKKEISRLSRVYTYVGPAWYQKDVTIPQKWRGNRITLFLERCHWETQVFVDHKPAGMKDSLCVPHIYDLTSLMTPGNHLLTIRVDNNIKINLGSWALAYVKTPQPWAHSITEETQTNWNGIIGRIELQATDPVWIQSLQVYPDIEKNIAKTVLRIRNATGKPIVADVNLQTEHDGIKCNTQHAKVAISQKEKTVELNLPMGQDVKLWDEFSPTLYQLTASISASTADKKYSHTKKTKFGMRQMATKGTQITINRRLTFLRGNLDCCIFPLTGYPSMDPRHWLRIFKIAKSYGINHIRYHSWCPPEAAFVAADQLGLMFQVETPVWCEVGNGKPVDDFIYAEADRILETFGNHPSFTMLCVGNELDGKNSVQFCSKINRHWRQKDPRHLYAGGSGRPESPTADYFVLPRKNGQIRLQGGPLLPATDKDYRQPISHCDKPVVAHEITQWCVYPNFNEIDKYTGVLKARNFEVFRDSLAKNHMLEQADDFLKASGALNNLLFKAGIETILRTPGIAGFQLLSLHDFPGQGTSLVGTLDAFWDSKGLIQPHRFRQFCNQTVPLLRLTKRIFTPAETFSANVEIAHFGPHPLKNALPRWSIQYVDGEIIVTGKFNPVTIPVGNDFKLGTIKLPLSEVTAARKLIVTVSLLNTPYKNQWEIWVYPGSPNVTPPADVIITQQFDPKAKSALQASRKVLLVLPAKDCKQLIPSSFEPIFWNKLLFKGQNRHLGILCDPKHPAFAQFPTEFHTNWQWWDLLNKSKVMILDNFDPGFRPIVQTIDDWNTNHRLASLFETNLADGKLIVSSIDLLNNLQRRPAAKQLLSSILYYMASDKFAPTQTVDIKLIENLCKSQ